MELGHSDDFKDDIIMIQFKLVQKESPLKKWNTLTFLNIPMEKGSDPNIETLQDVMYKLKVKPIVAPALNKRKETFIPYNKSILTRIIAPQFSKGNILIVNHMTKHAVMAHL